MNEMKHFFNTTSVDTIGECLNGEKLLNAYFWSGRPF